jgi:hypothetical protein
MSSKPSKTAGNKVDPASLGSSEPLKEGSELPNTPARDTKTGKGAASGEETKKQKIKPLPPPGGIGDKKAKKEETEVMATPPNPTAGNKNFDFTLNNGSHLEEISEQLKEESHILNEWESKQK